MYKTLFQNIKPYSKKKNNFTIALIKKGLSTFTNSNGILIG